MTALCVAVLAAGMLALGTIACSGSVDSRCRIDAGRHGEKIAKSVASSRLWDMYFDKIPGSSPLVELKVNVERRKNRGYGGDYDGGKVKVVFEARSLKHGDRLLKEEGEFEIDSFLITGASKDATREELQEIAFLDAEKESYPYLDRWIQLAALKAIGREGEQGGQFVPELEKMVEDKWTSADMRVAAKQALSQIRG